MDQEYLLVAQHLVICPQLDPLHQQWFTHLVIHLTDLQNTSQLIQPSLDIHHLADILLIHMGYHQDTQHIYHLDILFLACLLVHTPPHHTLVVRVHIPLEVFHLIQAYCEDHHMIYTDHHQPVILAMDHQVILAIPIL